MDIKSATSYPFGFSFRSKRTPLDTLTLLFTTLSNQYNKVAFIQVDRYGALSIPSEFMRTCHIIKIIVQTLGVDEPSINGKSEISNKTLDNITRTLLLN